MPNKSLIDHIKENHCRFHFFFVFVISTAIVMGLFFVQLPRSVIIQAQTILSPPPPGQIPPPPGPRPQSVFEGFNLWQVPTILTGLACYTVRFGIIVSVIAVLASGIAIILSRGNPAGYANAKKFLLYAIIGGLVIYGVYTIILSVSLLITGSTTLPWIPLTCS